MLLLAKLSICPHPKSINFPYTFSDPVLVAHPRAACPRVVVFGNPQRKLFASFLHVLVVTVPRRI